MPASTAPPDGSLFGLLAGSSGVPPVSDHPDPADPPPQPARPLLVAAVLLGSGLLLATALSSTRRGAPDLTRQRSAIEAQVAARTQAVDGLQAARQRLQKQIVAARNDAATVAAENRSEAATVGRLGPVVGVTAVRGSGLTVTLSDAPVDRPPRRQITDSDLAQVVNVLWAAGAEAVAVNGVRLTARSAIRSAGDAVLVNLRPLTSPYRITALGLPDSLAATFANSSAAARLRTGAAVYGTGVSVQVGTRLTLPPAAGLSVSLARPANPEPTGSPR
ncbi:MAG: DUF881 domain-containing protein [Frankiaceae bacterium]